MYSVILYQLGDLTAHIKPILTKFCYEQVKSIWCWDKFDKASGYQSYQARRIDGRRQACVEYNTQR